MLSTIVIVYGNLGSVDLFILKSIGIQNMKLASAFLVDNKCIHFYLVSAYVMDIVVNSRNYAEDAAPNNNRTWPFTFASFVYFYIGFFLDIFYYLLLFEAHTLNNIKKEECVIHSFNV